MKYVWAKFQDWYQPRRKAFAAAIVPALGGIAAAVGLPPVAAAVAAIALTPIAVHQVANR